MSTPTPAPPATAGQIQDAMFKEITTTVTSLLPNIADDVKKRLEDDLKRRFSAFLEALKKDGKSTTAEVLAAGRTMLDSAKKEIGEIISDMKDKNMSAKDAINQAVNDFMDTMKIDPKFKDIVLHLDEKIATITKAVEDAKKYSQELGEQLKAKTKNAHEITLNALYLILSYLVVAGAIFGMVAYIWGLFTP